MHNFRVICFLAVSFCLVICVSANAEVSLADARAAVDGAKVSVTAVHARAQSELNKANSLLQRVELSKSQTAQALSKAKKTATGNAEAEEIAQKIKSLSDAVEILYSDAQQKLDTAVKSLNTLLAEAKELEGESTIEITPNTGTADDYTGTNTKATTLKGKADNLNPRITAAIAPVSEVDAKPDEMESKAKEAQLGESQVSAIVAVATIERSLAKADNIIGQIEDKKNEVSGIVDEMKTLKTNALTVSDDNINALLQSATDALGDAKGAVENAKSAKLKMTKQKDLAKEALARVKEEKENVSNAQGEVRKAEECVTAAEQSFLQLNNPLETATNSLTNAKALKQKIMTALSTTTTAPNTVQATETEKTNSPVGQGTEPDQKDTTMQPTSKELPSQSGNSADKLKDALIKGVQNVPTTVLTGGKAPAPGANNDSAMTVSVPLLVALIASAVWQ